jgi:hypothetical protein
LSAGAAYGEIALQDQEASCRQISVSACHLRRMVGIGQRLAALPEAETF